MSAAEVMHRAIKTSCGDGCPYPDCCYSDGRDPYRVQALADAGLLLTDADRAVLAAADAWFAARGVRSIEAAGKTMALLAAVRARREAQP